MIRRLAQVLGVMAALVVLAAVGVAIYVARTWNRVYDAPSPDVQVSTDPAVLARGEYLVYGPAHCVERHGGSYDVMEKLAAGEQVPLKGGTALAMRPLGDGPCVPTAARPSSR
jgi:hypothetical protein